MKLNDSKCCVQCEEIVALGEKACPSCTSTHFFFLGPDTLKRKLTIAHSRLRDRKEQRKKEIGFDEEMARA